MPLNLAVGAICAVVGALVGGGLAAGSAWFAGRPVEWRAVLAAAAQGAGTGFVGGLTFGLGPLLASAGAGLGGLAGYGLSSLILGQRLTVRGALVAALPAALGGGLYPLLSRLGAPLAAALSASLAGAFATLLANRFARRPWSQGLLASVLLGAVLGGGLARVAQVVTQPRPYASVHGEPPSWLAERFQRTIAASQEPGWDGPPASPAAMGAFLKETFEHVEEVNALVTALGGKARPLPARTPAADDTLRGIHDLGERVSVRRLEEWMSTLSSPPGWLHDLTENARRTGATTIDVGKLSPQVAAGLSSNGPPDRFAIGLHNLSAHHKVSVLKGDLLVEAIADNVSAMRQVRIYRPAPMPFELIRKILAEKIEKGALPSRVSDRPDARTTLDLVDEALRAQAKLEKRGGVNPYHRVVDPVSAAPSRTAGVLGALGR